MQLVAFEVMWLALIVLVVWLAKRRADRELSE